MSLVTSLIPLLMPSQAQAVEVLFGVEAVGVQATARTTNVVTEDFEEIGLSAVGSVTGGSLSGRTLLVGDKLGSGATNDLGTITANTSPAKTQPASQYGGADGTGYFVDIVGTSLDITLTTPARYVGFYWPSGNAGNSVNLYGSVGGTGTETLLGSFDSSALTNLHADYKGNPSGPFSGQDAAEYFAYVNLVLDDSSYYITKLNFSGTGFEPDNLSVSTDYSTSNISSPTIAITAAQVNDSDTSADASLSLTFTTSSTTADFTGSDISVANGTISNFSGSGTTYTATFTPTSGGATTISVASGKFTQSSGVGNANSAVFDWTYQPLLTDWVDWTIPSSYPYTNTTNSAYSYATSAAGNVSDPNNGNASVTVNLTGEVMYLSQNTFTWYNAETPADSFDIGTVSSPNGEDIIMQTGYTAQADKHHTISFSSAVNGVVMGLWSLGGGQSSTLLFSEDFVILDTESAGGLTKRVTNQGYELIGTGDNSGGSAGTGGLIQFCGSSINSITYTVTAPEFYSGMSVALTNNVLSSAQISSCGASQSIDVTAPTLTSSSPADDETNVAVSADITLTFNENIVDAGGSITLKKASDSSTVQTFTGYSVSGNTVTLSPTNNLGWSTAYYLEISSTAVKDGTGNGYVGLSGTTALNFITISNDTTAPSLTISADNGSVAVANGSATDDASLTMTFTLSEAVGSSPNDFVAADIALTNATLGNDFACASLVCTVTLLPTATGLVTVNVAAASFKDVAGNDNLLATQFSWTYGVDPTQKESVTSLLQGTSSISKELKNNNIKAVYNRLAWLNRNVDQKNKSHQGVRVTFTDPLFDEYFNGSRGPDLDVTVGDAMMAVKRYDDNPDLIAVEAREQSRILVASTARTNLGSVNLNPTADAFYKNWYVWTSGTYTVGGIDATASTDKQESTGQALSIGVDRVFGASGNIMGFALTYGDDHIKMGTNGSKIDSASYSVSTYSQYKIANLPKFEILLGTGQADMAMERVDGSQTLTSAKKSTVVFGSVGMRGQTYKQGKLLITPYGQLESAYIKLPSTNEAGGSMALAYSEQILRENTAAIGINLDFEKVIGSRSLRPYGKLQLARDYSSDSGIDLNYVGNSTIYSIAPSTGQASKWTIAMGADYILSENAKAAISVESTNSSGSFLNSARIELNAAF
ncbi:autotransporter domain-containing protein [Oceanospirillaceae bacterium]|nr:autotransporter domain-containing protein [Oceanospirillaceae bacterium]